MDPQARFDGVRAPLGRDGNRMATIAIQAQRDAVGHVLAQWHHVERAGVSRSTPPLDIELSGDGGGSWWQARHAGQHASAGCRAVEPAAAPRHRLQQKPCCSRASSSPSGLALTTTASVAAGTHSLALSSDGNVIAVGASLDAAMRATPWRPNNRGATNSGAVYLFVFEGDTWSKQAFIKARGAKAHDHLGHAVALSEDGGRLFGGARGLSANVAGINRNHAADQPLPSPMPGQNGALTGAAAYVFEHAGAQWVQLAAMAAPNASRANFDTHFSLAVSGSTVALSTGEPAASVSAPGAMRSVFLY